MKKIDRDGMVSYYEAPYPYLDQLHRKGSPAQIYPGGDTLWRNRGVLHRFDWNGPAALVSSGASWNCHLGGKLIPVASTLEAGINRFGILPLDPAMRIGIM